MLLWIGLTDAVPRGPRSLWSRCFNPCCCGSDSRTPPDNFDPTDEVWCFNPCCCGSDSRTLTQTQAAAQLGMFQSLLLWIGLTDRSQSDERDHEENVSILVVVDRTHGPSLVRPCENCSSSFNPCCCGSDSRTSPTIRRPCAGPRVSILVVVDRTHGRLGLGEPQRGAAGFQSLLLWIGLTDETTPYYYTSTVKRFQSLLLWIGLTDASRAGERWSGEALFQSLLLWIGLTDAPGRSPKILRGGGFNPCCCGSDSRTMPAGQPIAIADRFQSLLLWIGLTDFQHTPRIASVSEVSILVVVDRTHGLPMRDLIGASRRHVSILVVVDRTHGRPSEKGDPPGHEGFNPCCCGSDSRTSGDARIRSR